MCYIINSQYGQLVHYHINMPNILDLISSDFRTFAQRPFNATDSLVFCELSYLRMPSSVPLYSADSKGISTVPITDLLRAEEFSTMFSCGSPKVDEFRKNLLMAVLANPRYRGLRVGEVLERFDESHEQQFAGVTFDLSNCEGIDDSFFDARSKMIGSGSGVTGSGVTGSNSVFGAIGSDSDSINSVDSDFVDSDSAETDSVVSDSVETDSAETSSIENSSDSGISNNSSRFGFFASAVKLFNNIHNISQLFGKKSSMFSNLSKKRSYSGALVVAFRGTDNTLVGWKEDFNMAFRCPIPAQESAEEYLTSVAKRSSNKRYNLRSNIPRLLVAGHSKGGNMAVYASMKLDSNDKKLGSRIEKIYSMDGPGFASDVVNMEVFSDVSSRVEKVVPTSAFIGLLMDSALKYRVTQAESIGLMQHFGMYWQIKDGDFAYCDSVTPRALAVSNAVNHWMSGLDFDDRKRRIDNVYNALSSLGYCTFDEMSLHWSEVLPKLWQITSNLDVKSKELLRDVLMAFTGLSK